MDHPYDYLIGDMLVYMSYGMECFSEKEMEHFGSLLPREVHHTPDEVKRISCLETLRATTENLKRWLKDGMEENRFGLPFVQTTKMIMDAVTTIGRGLVTLHVLGEDLSEAPMQIGELLDIAGFHFKKCSDGVRVSAGVNPTVCTRLFTCQLRWQNLIFRLYRTEEFLSKPVKSQKKLTAPAEVRGALDTAPSESAHSALKAEQAFRAFPTEGASAEAEARSAESEAAEVPAEVPAEEPAAESGTAENLTEAQTEVQAVPEAEDAEMPEPLPIPVFGPPPERPPERWIDPIDEAIEDDRWDNIPYVSDALVQRMLERIRDRKKEELYQFEV